jgi:hypothetical protein
MIILSWMSCHDYSPEVSFPTSTLVAILSLLSVKNIVSWFSSHDSAGGPIVAVLSSLLSRLRILTIPKQLLSWLFCHGCVFQTFLSELSLHACLVSTVLAVWSSLSCHGCPDKIYVKNILFTVLSRLNYPDCHFTALMKQLSYPDYHAIALFFWQYYFECPVMAALYSRLVYP